MQNCIGLHTAETNPHLAPARLGVGIVEVTLSGEEQDDGAGLDRTQIARIGLKITFAFGDVDELVFVERASLLGEIIIARVSRYGILFVRLHVLVADRRANQSPFLVLCVR